MEPQGWYFDPFGVHEQRWFSGGTPTGLVRDGDVEAHDDPPPSEPWAPMMVERVDEAPAPRRATVGMPIGPYQQMVVVPPPIPFHQAVRNTVGYLLVPSVVPALIALGVFLAVDPSRALAAAGIAAVAGLLVGGWCWSIQEDLRMRRARQDVDWSEDLYPR